MASADSPSPSVLSQERRHFAVPVPRDSNDDDRHRAEREDGMKLKRGQRKEGSSLFMDVAIERVSKRFPLTSREISFDPFRKEPISFFVASFPHSFFQDRTDRER